MFTDHLDSIITAIVSICGGGSLSWIFAKRKYKAETDSTHIDNMQKSLDFYVKNSEENRLKLEEWRKENDNLRDENVILKNKVADSEVKIHALELQVKGLQENLASIKQTLKDLKRPSKTAKKKS